jgi:hypothetical protein
MEAKARKKTESETQRDRQKMIKWFSAYRQQGDNLGREGNQTDQGGI